jgi:nucleoid DNA-binding protein
MKKPDLAKRMARAAGVSPAEAADRLDEVVRQILQSLREGRTAALPGLGLFTRGPDGKLAFQREERHGVPPRPGEGKERG